MITIARTELGITATNGGCNCSTHHAQNVDLATRATESHSAESVDYLVEGMTCSHCVSSVTEGISAIEGVETVAIDLQPGGRSLVTVSSSAPILDETIRAVVEEAGYTISSR